METIKKGDDAMRNLYVFNMITVDGFFDGAQKWEIGWHNVDAEFNQFAIAQLDATGMLLFGRVTYQGMAGYWASPDAIKNDAEVANRMNAIPKVVFSRTLEKADWNNTRLIKTNLPEEILKIKQAPGKDIALFGSANLMTTLVQHNLIDEYRLMLNPVVLGKGEPLFAGTPGPIKLKLLQARPFKNGNVLLSYQPEARKS
jgi:dihydrofolate reductase